MTKRKGIKVWVVKKGSGYEISPSETLPAPYYGNYFEGFSVYADYADYADGWPGIETLFPNLKVGNPKRFFIPQAKEIK